MKQGSSTVGLDHRANHDLGRIFEIAQPTKISDGSSKSPRESRSWTALRNHRENQELD